MPDGALTKAFRALAAHRLAAFNGAGLGLLAGLMLLLPPDAPVLHCWVCGQLRPMIPIVYGLPGNALIEAADRGEVVLGGCMVPLVEPARACGTCRTPIVAWDPWNAALVLLP